MQSTRREGGRGRGKKQATRGQAHPCPCEARGGGEGRGGEASKLAGRLRCAEAGVDQNNGDEQKARDADVESRDLHQWRFATE